MRQKKPRRSARRDRIERGVPNFEIDIRRRRQRNHIRFAFDVESGRVANKCGAIRRIKIRNVMRRVPRRVHHLDLAAAERESLSAFEHAQIPKRHRQRLAK